MNYNDVPFSTGDIILFSGSVCGTKKCFSHFLSCVIKTCTQSKYSHCGIVIKNPLCTPEPLDGLYILESTGLENIPDATDNKIKFGVQLRKLDEVIDNYDGKVYWRQVDCDRNQTFYKKLATAYSVVYNKPYDLGFEYIKALFELDVGSLQNKKTFVCSALVAFILVSLGLLPSDTKWSIVTPKELSSYSNKLGLNKFVQPEIRVIKKVVRKLN